MHSGFLIIRAARYVIEPSDPKNWVLRPFFFALFFLCLTHPAWSQDDRAKQIESAKKEGKLAWYTSTNVTESKPLLNDFEKQYPFIKGEIFRASGEVTLNRIFTETRGGTVELRRRHGG